MFGTHEIHTPLPDNPIRDGTMNRNCGLPSNMAIVCDLGSPGVVTST